MSAAASPVQLVVLISGNGSNLQAIIDAIAAGTLHARITAVISNRANALGLQRAQAAGITCEVIDHKTYPDRAAFDHTLMQTIDRHHPDLVILAGFMRILSDAFVDHYLGRMLNIHPSLLPQFTGLHTHQRALDAGAREHGASVHFVTRELDGGPVIIQARVPVLPGDDAQTLAQRVLAQEHHIYVQAIAWYAHGRLRYANGKALLDGQPITP